MDLPLIYALTTLAPKEINEKFVKAKEHFDLLIDQEKTLEENYILKNLAHITLVTMFQLTEPRNEELIRSKLDSISFEQINIHANDIEVFPTEEHGNVVVIKVKKTAQLQEFHENLLATTDGLAITKSPNFEKSNYTPLLSVLYNVPDGRIVEATNYVQDNIIPIEFTLESFLFMKGIMGVKNELSLIKEYFATN